MCGRMGGATVHDVEDTEISYLIDIQKATTLKEFKRRRQDMISETTRLGKDQDI
jgi:hypothetical protein